MDAGSFLDRLQQQLAETPKSPIISSTQIGVDESSFPSLPASAKSRPGGWVPPVLSNYTERFELAKQSNQRLGKNSWSEVCKKIMVKLGVKIEMSVNQKTTICVISGKMDAVKLAKKQVLNALAEKITFRMTCPADCKPFVAGKGFSVMKEIMATTLTTISMPRSPDGEDAEISITGDPEAVKEAKLAIDAIIKNRNSRYSQTVNIDVEFQPFMDAEKFQKQYNVKIHVPPADKKSEEIRIVGEKNAVLECVNAMSLSYEKIRKSIKTLSLNIPKKQHRLIFGSKGSGLADIFARSGCLVEIPGQDVESDEIILRGPENLLTLALQLALEKAIESNNSATIIQNGIVLEIQAKNRQNLQDTVNDLTSQIKQREEQYFFGSFKAPREFYRYIIGKGGQNLAKLKDSEICAGRLEDAIIPQESDTSDEITLIIRNKSTNDSKKLFEEIKTHILNEAAVSADMTTESLNVDAKFHGRIIGAKGASLNELLEPYGKSISVTFKDDNQILIRGPKDDTKKLSSTIEKMVSLWKKWDSIINFSGSASVETGLGKKLIGTNCKAIGWITKAVREAIGNKSVKLLPVEKSIEAEITSGNTHMFLEFELIEGNEDLISFKAPKSLVPFIKSLLLERAEKILDYTKIEFDIFESLSTESQENINNNLDLKKTILRKIIGKEGKMLNKITSDFNVFVDLEKNEEGLIRIKGSKAEVQDAKDAILAIAEEEAINSYVLNFQIAKAAMPRIVGRSGANLNDLRNELSIKIDFDDDGDVVNVTLQGSRGACQEAQERIENQALEITETNDYHIYIPSFIHRFVIGAGGSNIRQLIEEFGGQDKLKISFGKEQFSDTVTITASSRIIENVQERFNELVAKIIDEENPLFITKEPPQSSINIPLTDLASAFGRSMDGLLGLMKKYRVVLWLSGNKDSVKIDISGEEHRKVEKEIASKIRKSVVIPIPQNMQEKMQNDGAIKDYVLNALAVLVKKAPRGISAELATDIANGIAVRGEDGLVSQFVKQLEKSISKLANINSAAEVEIPSSYVGHIIGRKGQTIKRVRDESGAFVEIGNEESETVKISIAGIDAEQVSRARAIIDTLVNEQAQRLEAKKGQESAARIDDEDQIPAHVPGYVPPGYHGNVAKKISSVVKEIDNDYKIAPPIHKHKEVWQKVVSKNKIEHDTSITEDGLVDVTNQIESGTQEKKKKKKKKSAKKEPLAI